MRRFLIDERYLAGVEADNLAYLRTRRKSRGATMFLVTLVITLLTAMGVFAARAASLNQLAIGYDRLNEQTHYVMEHGVLLATAELGQNPAAYLKASTLNAPGSQCYSLPITPGNNEVYPCAKFSFKQINQNVMAAQGTAAITPAGLVGNGSDPEQNTAGSLGAVPLNPLFYVEMTDIGPASRPPAGSAVGDTGASFGYLQVSLGAWGQVGPYLQGANAVCGANEANAALVTSREAGRAQVTVGPIPKR